MASILDELEELDRKLKAFPIEAHWFCPKRHDDDTHNYDEPDLDEPDLTPIKKARYIAEGHKRLSCAYRFSLVFGLSPDEAGDLLTDYAARSTQLLTSCDRCVRNYHLGRKGFLKDLAEEFDEDIVQELARRIEDVEFTRIDRGLFQAEKVLSSVPDSQKHINYLAKEDFAALTGLYEALCCENYHKSSEKLFFPLGDVMRLVQIGKPLRLGDLVPATTRFLFDEDQFRHRFATAGWKKLSDTMDSKTFDWVVKDSLIDAIQSVSTPTATVVAIKRFWDGILLIVDKLDHSLITHSLQGMEVQPDIYHLALQHLACNSDNVLNVIIRTLRILLRKSPQAFWEAYGAISPATVAEQVFNSPAFETLLSRSFADDVPGEENVPDAVAWIPPFVQSLPPAQQHDACRSVLFNLFERFQDGRISERSRIACCRAGLDTLVNTLTTFTDKDYRINPSTSFIMINGILSLVDKYKDVIVSSAMIVSDLQSTSELSRLGMLVIRRSLFLDCKALNSEFQALQSGGTVDLGLDSHSQSIWSTVLGSLRPNGMELVRHILVGITPLIGLESFTPESRRDRVTKAAIESPLSKDRISFNDDFGQLTEIVALVFGRLMDFTPDNLKVLCSNQLTARPLLAALTAADQATNEAAVEVIKTLTGEDGRSEAITKLLEDFLEMTLNSLAFAARKINGFQTFAAVPSVLKIGRDVLDTLCDAQVGILRTRSSPTKGEQAAIKMWWSEQWHVVTGAFSMTEKWSEARSSAVMTDFCRDAMDYAEALFDQYNLVASALSPNDGASTASVLNDARKIVLQDPREAVEGLIKFLRLKDPYLASTIVSLLSKILRRLGEFDMEIDKSPSRYIESVVKTIVDDKGRIVGKEKGGVNTILTGQQKAELGRALEEHHGLQEIPRPTASVPTKKPSQGTIDAWSRSANGVLHEPHAALKADLKQSVIDVDRWQSSTSVSDASEGRSSLTRNLDASKSALDEIRSRQKQKLSVIQNALPGAKAGETPKQTRDREKEEKRMRDVAFAKSQRNPALVTGEGSGLKGLGVQGKDHAPLRGELMVGSDDESSEDEDEADARSLIKSSKEGSRKALELEEHRKRLLKQNQPQGPVRKTKIIRSAKDMRARLIPNMDNLHLTILDWDIFHKGEDPPGGIEYLGVTESFKTPLSYKDTFHPLLISEAWRSFSSAKDENNSRPFQIKVVNRMSVDQFYEVSTSMAISENREVNMMEGDIVLLSKGLDPLKDSRLPNCLARAMKITRKKDVIEISYRVSVTSATNGGLISSLAPNLSIHGFKITSMTTIEREYAALASLEYYDLCEEILEAKPSPLLPYSQQVIDPVRRIYDVNMGQAKAVWSAKENDAFTLIQGPPGSGKTKTIVAMVGALLTDTFNPTGVSIERPRTGGMPNPPPKPPQKKLLVCAPSNAAVDELVNRLKEGVKTLRGEFHKINVIRLGRSDAINANVKDVTLDELVRAKIEGNINNGKTGVSEREKLHLEAGRLKEQLALLRPQLEEARSNDDKILESRLQRDYDTKRRDQLRIGARIDAEKDSGNTAARDNEIRRRLLQQEIIDSAHVLCATLSGSGHEMFKNLKVEFETVIIDEAAQCVELSALIPLKYGCSKCILVGDPKQLPPTVLSRSAARNGYERSLFVRMQENHPDSVHLLDMQYRMHPEISRFPSAQFYDGKLLDGSDMANLREKPWHKSELLGPYRFFDVKGVQATGSKGHSYTNIEELRVAMQLYDRLKSDYNEYDLRGKVGIITPYKAQLTELRNRFRDKYGDDILEEIEFNTTDAFQGRESEIIIFSCVRARASGGIGFLEDIRRMNVGLTRAKSSLWVLGDSKSLLQGEFWAKLINDAKLRRVYTDGDILEMLKRTSNVTRSMPKIQNAPAALVNRPLQKSSFDGRGNPIPKLSIPDTKTKPRDGLGKRPLTPKFEFEGPSVKKHHAKVQSPTDIEMVDAPPMANDAKSAHPQSGNADEFLKRYRRPPSPLHDIGHLGKKIPSGPKSMRNLPPLIPTTTPARTPAGIDPAAMATLKAFQNQALPSSNTEISTALGPKPAEQSKSPAVQEPKPSVSTGGAIPPRIVKKRPPADPLRRNLPPGGRPR